MLNWGNILMSYALTFAILACMAAIVCLVQRGSMLRSALPEVAQQTLPEPDGITPDAGGLRIIIRKQQRRLELYRGAKLLQHHRVALGFNPIGDKQREGDGCTPEGTFYVCEKNAASKYYLSLGISYPGIDDADRGLRANQITPAEHARIVAAIDHRRTPPWKTNLGGEIFIHGGGATKDWTHGCVALENSEMKDLFEQVQTGTEVQILP